MAEVLTPPVLVLASASPRRQALLRAGGVNFEVRISGVNEEAHQSGEPRVVALKTALAKAVQVASSVAPGTLILAADTMVVMDGRVFTKPESREQARRMLEALAGRKHTVITALALLWAGGEALVDAAQARVTFNPLPAELIESYLASGEADDKAGAYGIQGLGSRFVAAAQGDLTCVIGLPLGRLAEMARALTCRELFGGRSLREVTLKAFPDLAALPPACLEGIPC